MDNESHSISYWLAQVKEGDSLAAQRIWQQYYVRLVGIARKQLRDSPRRVADEEDMVLCAFENFFRGARDGRFPKLEDRDDLWQVLVMLTARKCANEINYNHRKKRGDGKTRGESVFDGSAESPNRGIDQIVGESPSPEFTGQLTVQCQELLNQLEDDVLEKIAIAKMEGYTNGEISHQLEMPLRSVERKLMVIREIWAGEEDN